jgi:phosphoglycerol transferase MdoB-like AlkP superfamily enzyme
MKNKLLSAHYILDFILGLLTILLPFYSEFKGYNVETIIPILIGASVIAVTAITRSNFSIIPILHWKENLFVNFLTGAFLALSPWLYNYYGRIFLLQLMMGILIMISSALPRFAITKNLFTNKKHLQKITYRI